MANSQQLHFDYIIKYILNCVSAQWTVVTASRWWISGNTLCVISRAIFADIEQLLYSMAHLYAIEIVSFDGFTIKLSVSSVSKNIAKLKELGLLERIGSKRNGYFAAKEPNE